MPKRNSNTADAEPEKSWQSVRRNISRVSIFLASNLFMLITPVLGVPVPTSKDSLTSTNTTAPPTSSARATRDSSFQVIADGTQDIAALVGLFATDSVERRVFDFGRGYLAASVSNLSLLGMLGYVRLLVKLGLGVSGCQRAGFDTKALRPMWGIQDDENVPAEAIRDIYHIQNQISSDGWITWRVVKQVRHTKESFPLHRLGVLKASGSTKFDRIIHNVWLEAAVLGPTRTHFSRLTTPLFLAAICSCLTCFPTMILAQPAVHQTWTYYYATFGLVGLLTTSNVMWTWAHFLEHHPHGPIDSSIINHSEFRTHPLAFKDSFACSPIQEQYHIYEVRIVEERIRKALSIASLLISLLTTLGYICQYVEVRRLEAHKSGLWLSIQGVLALIRVSIWVWDPSWDRARARARGLVATGLGRPPSQGLCPLVLARLSVVLIMEEQPVQWPLLPFDLLSMPKWALLALQACSSDPHTLFELARKMRSGGPGPEEALQIMKSAECSWDFPPVVFVRWLHQWLCRNPFSENYNGQKLFQGKNISCRLIKARKLRGQETNFHLIPFMEKVNPRLNAPDITAHQVGVVALALCNTDDRDESVFTFRNWKEVQERKRIGINKAARTFYGQIHVQGWDTEIPRDDVEKILPGLRRSNYLITPRRLLGNSIIDTEQDQNDFRAMWEAIDYSLNPHPTTGDTVSLPLDVTRS